MDHTDITSFTEQESFLNYCFKRNDEDVLYWEKWLAEHPAHQQEVENLRQMVLLMGEASHMRTMQAGFNRLQAKIKQSKPPEPFKIYPFLKKWSIAAAASLIVIGAGLYVFYPKGPSIVEKVQDVPPGGNRAVLILGNGQKVDLTHAANGAIASQSGIKVRKTASGQLIYDVSNVSQNAGTSGYNTIETPSGGQYQINLSDGTKVWLNAASKLRYPVKFAGNERRVELTGEGYFEVAHNKAMPFKVRSARQTVEVLGTHFNIMAYPEEKEVKTTLLEGAVNVKSEHGSMRLIPGQQARLTRDKIQLTENTDLEDVVAWKDGYFKFNESLVNIMHKISRWYGVEVVYQTDPDPSLTYSGKISRTRNISAVLKIIEFNGDVHFKIEGRKIYVIK